MPRKTKEEAMKTRASIMKAAENAFFENGVVSTSLQEIAVRAGVTRGAVYWHFRDKADLLRAIADEDFKMHEEMLDRLISSNFDEPIEVLCKCSVDSITALMNDAHRRRVLTILTNRCEYLEEMEPLLARNLRNRDLVIDRVTKIFEQARAKGQLSTAWEPATAAHALQLLFIGMITTEMDWARPSTARDRIRVDVFTSFFKSLKA